MSKKKGFILHKDSLVILDEMTDEQAGKFLKIIYQYQISGTVPKLDFAMKMAIMPFINQFKRDNESYKKVCEGNRNNGSKGGKRKVANATERYRLQTNLADSDSDSDNKNDKDKEDKKTKAKKAQEKMLADEKKKLAERSKKFIPPTLEEVTQYANENLSLVDPKEFWKFYEVGAWYDSKGNPVKNWKQKFLSWHNREKKGSKAAVSKTTKSYNPRTVMESTQEIINENEEKENEA